MNRLIDRKIATTLGFVLMCYLVLRAYYIPLVHDEASTFFHYIHTGKFMPAEGGLDANNHFLNSFLTYLFYHLFGSGELSLRLANLIFFPVFFIFWFKLSELLSNRLIKWIFLLAGLFAHNFIEFFALSRGYGMSMALLTGSLWYFIKGFNEGRKVLLLAGTLCLFLALYANLSLLNTGILVTCLIFVYWNIQYKYVPIGYWNLPIAYKKKNTNIRWSIFLILLCAAAIVLASLRLFEMRAAGNLYYGSGEGFWIVTVRSLKKMLLDTHHRLPSAFIAFLVTFCSLGILFLILKSKDKLRSLLKPEFVFPFLLGGNICGAILLHKLFGVNYAEDRVGLYFLPLLIGSVCFVADGLVKQFHQKLLVLTCFPLLFFPVHFITKVNFSCSSLWSYENIPHRFYDKIAMYMKSGAAPPSMAGYRMRELPWAYQNFRHGGKAGIICYTKFPEYVSDFQIVVASAMGNWKKYYERIDYDKHSDLSLLKRKTFLSKKIAFENRGISTKHVTAREYFSLLENFKLDTLTRTNLYIESQFTFQSWQKPFAGWLVIVINDKNNNMLRYERIQFNWLKTNWNGSDTCFIKGLQLPALPPEAHTLMCYVWNKDKAAFKLTNGSCKVYRLIK